MKVALYARYSTDNQRDASIADQFRICRTYAEKQGWRIVDEYSDQAISGASLLRPGIQSLIADALRGRFSIVLAEGLIGNPSLEHARLYLSELPQAKVGDEVVIIGEQGGDGITPDAVVAHQNHTRIADLAMAVRPSIPRRYIYAE